MFNIGDYIVPKKSADILYTFTGSDMILAEVVEVFVFGDDNDFDNDIGIRVLLHKDERYEGVRCYVNSNHFRLATDKEVEALRAMSFRIGDVVAPIDNYYNTDPYIPEGLISASVTDYLGDGVIELEIREHEIENFVGKKVKALAYDFTIFTVDKFQPGDIARVIRSRNASAVGSLVEVTFVSDDGEVIEAKGVSRVNATDLATYRYCRSCLKLVARGGNVV